LRVGGLPFGISKKGQCAAPMRRAAGRPLSRATLQHDCGSRWTVVPPAPHSYDDTMTILLRDRLVAAALEWQDHFGVAPSITSALSEYDAALLVGHSPESFGRDCTDRTAVTKGCDFTRDGIRYQVKANRPSGKRGSFVTLVAKASNYDWDRLIWILYDKDYRLQEAWEWTVESYRQAFEEKGRLAPADMRKGRPLFPSAG
jgi:hypothetical protein